MLLQDPRAAQIVEDAILFGAGERYDLFAWCVMSNHVHVLLTPTWREAKRKESTLGQAEMPELESRQAGKPELESRQAGKPDLRVWDLPGVMKGIKGYTAHKINELDSARGRLVWQDESYDHWARDEAEMMRIIEYIEDNPVKAQLCLSAGDWRWSSARFRDKWRPREAFPSKERSES
jgi:putative transposase